MIKQVGGIRRLGLEAPAGTMTKCPQLGAGMGALKLNRGISSDSVSTCLHLYTRRMQGRARREGHFLEDELRDGVVVHGNSKGDDEGRREYRRR